MGQSARLIGDPMEPPRPTPEDETPEAAITPDDRQPMLVIGAVRQAFEEYERALMSYDVEALDRFFWVDGRTIRFGIAEALYGHAAIAAYRRTRSAVTQRSLQNTRILALGASAAVVTTEFRYPGDPRLGRQSQTWALTSEGWRIVAAHVSFQQDVEL